MKKPSIYSDRYTKSKVQKYKRYLYIALGIILFVAVFLVPYLGSKVKEYRVNQGFNVNSEVKENIEKVNIPGDTRSIKTVANGESYFLYKLTTGEEVKIIYKVEEGRVIYTGVEDPHSKVTYDISPNRTKILINEIGPQTIILFDKEKSPKNHTMETFDYAGNGHMNRSYYSTKQGFIWSRDAKFLNDDTIVFKSNVSIQISPVYIWAIDINTNKFKILEETRSTKLEILDKTIDGIKISMDGVENIIDKNLKVVED